MEYAEKLKRRAKLVSQINRLAWTLLEAAEVRDLYAKTLRKDRSYKTDVLIDHNGVNFQLLRA